MRNGVLLSASAFGLALAALGALPEKASAASAAYCALYAREYAGARVVSADADNALSARQRLEDQAFSRCLNLDVEPDFPASSVYYGAALEEVIGVMPEVAEGDASFDDETPVAAAPAPAPKPKPQAQVAANTTPKSGDGGKLKAWSPEWLQWCADHYPNSFDPATGTVLPMGATARAFCKR
jgi:hypothetical protein